VPLLKARTKTRSILANRLEYFSSTKQYRLSRKSDKAIRHLARTKRTLRKTLSSLNQSIKLLLGFLINQESQYPELNLLSSYDDSLNKRELFYCLRKLRPKGRRKRRVCNNELLVHEYKHSESSPLKKEQFADRAHGRDCLYQKYSYISTVKGSGVSPEPSGVDVPVTNNRPCVDPKIDTG
jgi:hypothetical protein